MIFTYFTGDEYHDDFYEYEVEDDEVADALLKILSLEEAEDLAKEFGFGEDLEDGDLKDILWDIVSYHKDVITDRYENDLKDFFERGAMESEADQKSYSSDDYSNYGVSRSWFH